MPETADAAQAVHVLITRPAAQGGALADLVARAGTVPVAFPALEIEPLAHARLADPGDDWVVFISRNAVRHGLAALYEGACPPARARLAAVGAGTARALREAGLAVAAVPPPDAAAGAEGLLAHPDLAAERIRGLRMRIVRGDEGRAQLREELHRRGAEVRESAVYRRRPAASDPGVLGELRARAVPTVAIVTSAAGAAALATIAGRKMRRWLASLSYVTISARVAEAVARHLGAQAITVAAGANDEALAAAVEEVRRTLVRAPRSATPEATPSP